MKDDPLFVFHGAKDRTGAHRLAEQINGEVDEFRTVIRNTPDGTVMLRTKGGAPEVTTARKKPEAVVEMAWIETDFTKRTYGKLTLTTLAPAMGGFPSIVRPITAIEMDDRQYNDVFLFRPFDKVETT